MKKLPIELQTLIVKELPTRDICRLQQTCKAFYDSLESNPEVWRECLRRQCGADVLWSSFSGFTPSELRRACTGTLRFKHRYRPGGHSKPPIPRLLPYNNQQSQGSDNPYPEIKAAFLVPGGRFLITVDKKWLRVWDLGPPGSLVEPCESASRELNCDDKALEIADVVVTDKHTVHLLIQEWYSQPTLPQSFGIEYVIFVEIGRTNIRSNTTGSVVVAVNTTAVAGQRSRSSTDLRYAFRAEDSILCESSAGFASYTQAVLIYALPKMDQLLHSGLEKELSSGALWILRINPGSLQPHGQGAGVPMVFLHQGYAFIVDSDGLNGFDLTGITHRPVGKGLVDIQGGAPDIGHIPTPQQWTHQQAFFNTFRTWASDFMLHKPVAKGGPLFYDIRHPILGPALPQPGTYETCDSYLQFCFSFRPDNPSASSLIPTKRYITDNQRCDTPHFQFALDERTRGYIWYDHLNGGRKRGNILVSILDNPDSGKGSCPIFEGLGDFSEMIARPNPEPTAMLNTSLCPLSGRVVVLCQDRESKKDRLVEIFDLYDFSLTT
ncbi:hypothetical protein D9611_001203 [Ephemerocybe angulata]|uniref:F-box domain-containing protein n=1 Tax=Ephemerocybe angulata TaxID=980116 RepID=A0A8H5CIP9_9AGAR|nr:hypothetical protein D9611_001203 [Tulosesus angulatus]